MVGPGRPETRGVDGGWSTRAMKGSQNPIEFGVEPGLAGVQRLLGCGGGGELVVSEGGRS